MNQRSRLKIVFVLILSYIGLVTFVSDIKAQDFIVEEEFTTEDERGSIDGIDGENDSVLLDGEEVYTDMDAFDIEIEIGNQSFFNKKVPVFVNISPNKDFEYIEVRFDKPGTIDLSYDNKFLKLDKGDSSSIKFVVTPLKEGRSRIIVTVIGWGGTNYSTTKSTDVSFDSELIITPKQAAYSRMESLKIGFLILLGIGILVGVVLFTKFLIKFLREYLKPFEY